MATYDFATITQQQAFDIQPTDIIRFTGAPARDASVIYHTAADSLDPTGFTLTFAGRAVDFGPALAVLSSHAGLQFADRSYLAVGGAGNDAFDGGPNGFDIAGGGNDGFFGGGGDDVLVGEGLNDAIQGNQGNDTIETQDGADLLYGGQGNDRITTGLDRPSDKNDFAQGNKGDDTIDGGSGSDTLLGGVGADSIDGGSGADVLNGNLGDDIIVSHGAAHLFGEDGADTLSTQAPGATLTGGAGADVFVVSTGSGQTAITDWDAGDHIHIDAPGLVYSPATYVEIETIEAGDAEANRNLAYDFAQLAVLTEGAKIIVVQVGATTFVFGDTGPNRSGVILEADIELVGRTLADVDISNFI